MICLKKTQRSLVKLSFDGHIHKKYFGDNGRERLLNEARVLEHLEIVACPFVPRLIDYDADSMVLVQTYCGQAVQRLSESKVAELFSRLHTYGVEHEDASLRNVTYRGSDGVFCLIDFEFARITSTSVSQKIDRSLDSLELMLADAVAI